MFGEIVQLALLRESSRFCWKRERERVKVMLSWREDPGFVVGERERERERVHVFLAGSEASPSFR